jgi:hypothetical protein
MSISNLLTSGRELAGAIVVENREPHNQTVGADALHLRQERVWNGDHLSARDHSPNGKVGLPQPGAKVTDRTHYAVCFHLVANSFIHHQGGIAQGMEA